MVCFVSDKEIICGEFVRHDRYLGDIYKIIGNGGISRSCYDKNLIGKEFVKYKPGLRISQYEVLLYLNECCFIYDL